MTLFEFIREYQTTQKPASSAVRVLGFDVFYVRIGVRRICGIDVQCLDIANVHAIFQGKGYFTSLIEEMQLLFPNLWIYVENVQSEQFGRGLTRRGFIRIGEINYYLEPLTAKIPSIQRLRYQPTG